MVRWLLLASYQGDETAELEAFVNGRAGYADRASV